MDENIVYFIMVALWVIYNIFKPNKKKKKPQQPQQQAPQQPQNKPRQRKVQPQQQPGQKAPKKKKPSSIESILEDYLKELEGQAKPAQNPNVKTKEVDQMKPKTASQTKVQPWEKTKSKKITKSSAVLTKQPEAYSFEDNIKDAKKYASKASADERKFAARAKTEKKRKLNMKKKMKSFDFNALDAVIYSEIINRKY